MGTPTSVFCENCGAANRPQTACCHVCNQSLQATDPAERAGGYTSLPVDTMLRARYRIVEAIGQGGMGTVYQARDTELNDRLVAVKEMHVHGLNARDALEAAQAFEREADLLANLQHTNLPSVFEHFTENGRWYMVMTFIQGETLEEHVKRANQNRLPPAEVLQISKQLCDVLYYLHSQYPPIIFRDVKPANIMRGPDGQVYLIDFGVARRFKAGQKKDTIPFGSPGYAPPEQFGRSQTTPRSDIYSLGATMHQLLSGHEPDSALFRFPSLRSLAPTVPLPLATLIEQMLDMDEMQRPANALVVKQKLQEIDAFTSPRLLASLSSPTPSTPRKARRHLWRALAITLLALSCLALSGLFGENIGASDARSSYLFNATSTTEAQNATVSAGQQSAALPDPYPPQGTLALVDTLNQANTWQESSNTDFGGSCQFKNSALLVEQSSINRSYSCDEGAPYTNFAIQVDMTIQYGNCGGLDLREDSNDSQMYRFSVCSDGTYTFSKSMPASLSSILLTNSSKAINQGEKVNTLAVVADGSNFTLYVNDQKLGNAVDSSYTTGTIGLIASANTGSAFVAYQNVVIWVIG